MIDSFVPSGSSKAALRWACSDTHAMGELSGKPLVRIHSTDLHPISPYTALVLRNLQMMSSPCVFNFLDTGLALADAITVHHRVPSDSADLLRELVRALDQDPSHVEPFCDGCGKHLLGNRVVAQRCYDFPKEEEIFCMDCNGGHFADMEPEDLPSSSVEIHYPIAPSAAVPTALFLLKHAANSVQTLRSATLTEEFEGGLTDAIEVLYRTLDMVKAEINALRDAPNPVTSVVPVGRVPS